VPIFPWVKIKGESKLSIHRGNGGGKGGEKKEKRGEKARVWSSQGRWRNGPEFIRYLEYNKKGNGDAGGGNAVPF